MELKTTYQELNAYIQGRFKQPVSLSAGEGGDLCVSYTKRVLIKDVSISVILHFVEVNDDSVVLSYKAPMGLDMIIGGAISFFKNQFSELSAGISKEEGNKIRIDLKDIKKAEKVVVNIALRAIEPQEEGLRIEFALKVPEK